VDQQVKLRGFRIELGEIEAALMTHDEVREATVIVYGAEASTQQLAAYIVPTYAGLEDDATSETTQHEATFESKAHETIGALRQYLKERLPEYMFPTVFIPLRQMPVTPNGKVDRKALPAPEIARGTLVSVPYEAPRNGVEEILAHVWGEVLKIEKVGVHDNFFALGGDSIRSLQVVGMCRERGLYLTLQQLFQYQTVAEQATVLQRQHTHAELREYNREPFAMVSEADRRKMPDDVEDAYPLSMLQGGMLYHWEVTPDAALYHNVNSFHLKAAFDERALKEATARVVARHEVLRTSFDLMSFSEPLQLVHREAEMSIGVEDLHGLSKEEQERRIDDFITEEKRRGFDYTRAPLLRFFIHIRDEQRFQFTLTDFHAIQDGWSLHTTLAEIFENYFRLVKGEELEQRAAEPVKYRDFVAMEREALASKEQHNYWQNKLYGNTFTNMPRWPRSMRDRASDGARVRFRQVPVPVELSEGVKDLARRCAVPLKSVALAAHLKVMSVLSGHRDVLTGAVSNGRPEESGGERAIGLFLNTLPFRLRLPEGNWADLVRATFDNEWELLPFRRYPMAALQHGPGREQLYETAFNYIHFHVVADTLGSGDVELLGTKMVEATNWALQSHFSLGIDTPHIDLRLEYDSDTWSDKQMDRVIHYFQNVLTAMATDPSSRHDWQRLLSEDELDQQLGEWTETDADYPRENTFAELFQQQVEQTPDAVAVHSDEGSLTYSELNRHANALAHVLIACGVGPESIVALLSERSTDFLISMLAVFKAGAAYLPLDPMHPVLRHLQVLEQSSASVIVRSAEFSLLVDQIVERLDPARRPQVFPMEASEWSTRAHQHRLENPARHGGPRNLAYVIYTSGSTGVPKGAMVEQRGMINHLWAKVKDLGLNSGDVVAQTASQCFDISVWQFLAALLVGGQVRIVSPERGLDPVQMLQLVREDGVTVLETVPSLLRALVDQARQQANGDGQPASASWGNVRWMVATGEALLPELCREWFLHGSPSAKLLNAYGPTECSDDVTHYVVESVPPQEQARIPIGRALANTQLYVLDDQMMPLPIGVTGELYVGGDGVGRGYLRDASRTARRFVPHPHAKKPGERLYRTGDVCRYLPNGEIEFLGRVDQQVKVRGYRIELGEIEAVLERHEEVKKSAVEVREDGTDGEKRLVAYVVRRSLTETGGNGGGDSGKNGGNGDGNGAPASGVTSRELWEYLRERLPEYMVPLSIMLLDEMPLTPNGKIDRKALPTPEGSIAKSEVVYVPPRNKLEQTIAKVWREVLHVKRVGMNDNFFDLGGHSIRMIEATSKLRVVLGRELSVLSMFEYPTVSKMAEFLSKTEHEEQQQPFAQDLKRAETRGERTRVQREARKQRRAAGLTQPT
jgi:amino acid adenylation domain-containing protein